MKNKLKEKIDKKLDALFSRVLDWSLQQWIAKISRVSVIETSFPKKKFKMAQDRYKDDSVCDTGLCFRKQSRKIQRKSCESTGIIKTKVESG